MKKILTLFLAVMMIFAATSALAADITVLVNGEAVEFDRQPVVEGETVLIPYRFVIEKLGAKVNWHEETQTVFSDYEGTITTIQIGNNLMFVNGDSFELANAPIISTDRTLVPKEVIENGIGAVVTWDAEASTVTIVK